MKRVDTMTILGIAVGISLVFTGIMIQGSGLTAFWSLSSLLITIGGSFGAVMVNFQLKQIKLVIQITRQVFVEKVEDISLLISRFVYLAQKARREGLLVLEDELEELDDTFFRNGLQMVIDGFEPGAIRDILETEIDALQFRHELGQNLYKTWGALAPAFGMLGTLIGLIIMLSNLQDPAAIGPGMALALLTTFYGVLFANLVLLPFAGKLTLFSVQEVRRKEAIVEGLLALQSGINPRLLQEQLKAYLSPAERQALDEAEKQQREDSSEEVLLDA